MDFHVTVISRHGYNHPSRKMSATLSTSHASGSVLWRENCARLLYATLDGTHALQGPAGAGLGSRQQEAIQAASDTGGAAAELDVWERLFQEQEPGSVPPARTDGLRLWDERRHCSGIV